MKLNSLKPALKKWEDQLRGSQARNAPPVAPVLVAAPVALHSPWQRPKERVAGGDIKWRPVDRIAARLLYKAPWWAQPVQSPAEPAGEEIRKPKRRKLRTYMKGALSVSGGVVDGGHLANTEYVSQTGLRVKVVNGETLINHDDVQQLLMDTIARLPKEQRPNVLAAQDARKIIGELLDGIGGEMERFNANSKVYLQDIRQTRFAVVSETAAMTKELKDVRQFFLGSDYHEQINRLREFVDLCERLNKLKDSGFLDSVADTMLRLAETKAA